ncbi:tubulin-like doman-containing protein [Occultella kanbiaonis]|uniref:tubulin-like doman-containing protein n=1 Tax=Occultella kanbiaonis TaxID=2675754 RepID=UPI0013D305EF|nr:tubulin-like doman-containing protein [Occultella kanbiaonis]
MLRPFLLVGVGGSGGKTLRVIREDLSRRLLQAGWTEGIPSAWQFLHIDVPTTADGNERDLPEQLPERSYQGLVGSGIDYRTLDDSLIQSAGTHARDALGGWRPDPDKVHVPASKGAGQYRALGRTIALSQLKRIATAVREARRQLTGAEVTSELQRLSEALGSPSRTVADDPQVIVIASIAGGSGSGAVLDVCDVIRSLGDKWANESVGILYCPDVFDDLDEGLRRGVRPNSLGALAELMSGYWSVEGPSESTSEMFQAAGISTGSSRRLGPRFPFLVGARNEHVTYKTQNDVYRAMGRSIASWVASSSLQDRLSAYTQAQWASTAQAVTDHLRLHPGGTETPFTALGSARVGLGRDRFRDYASEHLARSVVELVLNRHEVLRSREDERPPRQLIQEQATNAFGAFLAETGLDERGEERNDIIEALQRGDDVKAAGNQLTAEVMDVLRVAAGGKGFATDDVRIRIRQAVVDRRGQFAAQMRGVRTQRSREWVDEIQVRVVDVTADAVAKHGGPVAGAMLKRLVAELEEVGRELRSEADHRRRWAADLDSEISRVLGSNRNVTEQEVESAVDRAVQTLEWEQEAEVREMAVGLVADLSKGLLQPLTEAVDHGVESLGTDVASGLDGRGSVVSTWPSGDVIPSRLKPGPNEFLLEDVETFPTTLRALITRTVGLEFEREARGVAERQILTGRKEGARQSLLRLTQRWVPSDAQFQRGSSAAPARAAVSMAVSTDDVLGRATGWIREPGTPIGGYMQEGLRSYLSEDGVSPKEHADRLARFEGQFVAALNAGSPLVRVNTAVLTRVHNREIQYSRQFSEIPLPEKSAARQRLINVLEARKQFGPAVEQAFSDTEAAFIDIFTVLAEPYEPVVFDSLMRPIASDWGSKKATFADREEFWRWRRARPLGEAVPMHPITLAAMVRGYFVAALLKQVQPSPVRLYVPAGSAGAAGWLAFEDPLLVGDGRGAEALPQILESLSLTLLRVNDEESLAPMRPYFRLLDLGEGATNDLPADLRDWIQEGRRGQDPEVDASAPEERRAAAKADVERIAKGFSRHFDELEQANELLGYPGSFDLRHLIRSALRDLYRAIDSFVDDEREFL